MRIAICDDDPVFTEIDRRELLHFFDEKQMECRISTFQNSSELEAYMSEHPLDLVFMDIVLEEESGIDAAARIEKLQPDCMLAYCTNYLEYATEVYETRHCYYLLKENFAEKLPNVIRIVLKENEAEKQKICVKSNSTRRVIYLENIMYAERNGKKTILHLNDGALVEIGEKISELAEMLDSPEFVRCHNSFIISMTRMKKYSRQKIERENGAEIPISRPYINIVKDAFADWSWQNM